jgi:ribonuclease VapC
MVIDASAIVAVAFDEPEAASIESRIVDDPTRLISAASVLEASIVIEARYGEAGGLELDRWLTSIGAEIISVDLAQIAVARRAWRTFGKGRHPAGLNFGDCFSYALAKSRGEALLFKGNDFSKTDIGG